MPILLGSNPPSLTWNREPGTWSHVSSGALDLGAERAQFTMQVIVGAFDVVDIADLGRAIRDEGGQHAGGARADVERLYGRGCQSRGTGDDGGLPGGDDVGTQLPELGDIEQPVVEDALVDGAGAARLGEERGKLRLQVGREPGVGQCLGVHGRIARGAGNAHAAVGALNKGTRFAHLPDQRVEMLGHGLFDLDLPAGDGGGEGEGPCLEAVGDDAVLDASDAADAFDAHDGRAGGRDLRAHAVEHHGEGLDLGLAGGVDDGSGAFGEGCGQHDVQGAHDAGVVEDDALSPEGGGLLDVEDVAVLVDGGAEGAEAGEVNVKWADADRVTAGRGTGGVAR